MLLAPTNRRMLLSEELLVVNAQPVSVQLQHRCGIEFERIDVPLLVGHDPEEAVEFQLAIGPAGEVFREAGELAERRRGEIVDALKQELARHETSEGIVLGSSSWMATGRNPS